MEHTVLFEAVPATGIEDADVVAKVVIEQGSDWDNAGDAAWDGLEARIVSVEKGDLKKGDKIRMKIPLSSCGPWHKPGEEGLLIGKITGHDGDATLLQPYVRERGGNDGSVRLMN